MCASKLAILCDQHSTSPFHFTKRSHTRAVFYSQISDYRVRRILRRTRQEKSHNTYGRQNDMVGNLSPRDMELCSGLFMQ